MQGSESMAADILRIACGVFFVPHAAAKLRERASTVALLQRAGLPAPLFWVWLGIAIELVAATCLVLGFAVRPAAFAAAMLLLAAGAIVLRVSGGAWRWNEGGAEFPIFWAICCVVVAMLN